MMSNRHHTGTLRDAACWWRLSSAAALTSLAVLTGCSSDETTPLSTQEAAGIYDTSDRFCSDLDELGNPYTTPRPRWSDVEALGAYPDSDQFLPTESEDNYEPERYTTPDDDSRYPSYEWISANFRLGRSIQFLISTLTNVTQKIDSAQETLSSNTLATDLAELGINNLGGTSEQVIGYCYCSSVNGQNCDIENVLDQAQTIFDDLEANLSLSNVLQSSIDNLFTGLSNGLGVDLDSLELNSEDAALEQQLQNSVLNALDGWIAANTPGACTDAINSVPAFQTAVQSAVQNYVQQIQSIIADLRAAYASLVAIVPQLIQSFSGISDILSNAISQTGISNILSFDFSAFEQAFETFETQYEPLITQIKNLVDLLKGTYDDAMGLKDSFMVLIEDIKNMIASSNANANACVDALQNLDLSGPSAESLASAMVGSAGNLLENLFAPLDGLFPLVTSAYNESEITSDTLETAGLWLASTLTGDCFAVLTRPACATKCGVGNNVWVPEDFLQDPKAGITAAANGGLFILKQTGLLDTVNEWLANGPLVNALQTALGSISNFIARIIAILEEIAQVLQNIARYADRFTEGYHIGAYNDVRPDLHMCVGYAGHGVYAQFGNLGSDNFSIGARYTSHTLSSGYRAQVHSGGFAVSAFGHELSLAPGIEFQVGIDGWKMWNAQKPFGFPLGATINTEVASKMDIFNVLPEGMVQSQAWPVGNFFMKNLFPIRHDPIDANSTPIWPRPGVDAEWEGVSSAVFSAGLNLDLNFPKAGEQPFALNLASIPVYGPLPQVEVRPRLTFRTGISWIHDTNLMRQRIQDAINRNIPASAQLSAADFGRDMHAFQAPDVTQDNGTKAFVEPGIELGVFVGFDWRVVSIGIRFGIGYALNLKPGGYGGVADLNAALSRAFMNSNPPADAECSPILSASSSFSCNNDSYGSELDLSCSAMPAGENVVPGSCCMLVRAGETWFRMCMDSDLLPSGEINPEFCAKLTSGPHTDEAVRILNKLPSQLGSIINPLLGLLDTVTTHVETYASWSELSCSERRDKGQLCEGRTGKTTDLLPLGMDLQVSDTAASPCETTGMCLDKDGQTVAIDITREACEAKGLTWRSYMCLPRVTTTVEGWQGDGCHPFVNGYMSACGCSTDSDCASGETCGAGGQCTSGSATSCECGPGNSCGAGRTCRNGACALQCTTNDQCNGGRVCESGACVPPHGVPFAEEITWGMQNVQAPMHVINTYSLTEFMITNILTLGLDISMSINLGFFKPKPFTILSLSKAFDLGSKYKHWYQVGLEAQYQSECYDDSLDWPVTNRFPRAATNVMQTPIITGVSALNNCQSQDGGVCRYCNPLPMTMADQTLYPDGNCGDVETFIEWCKGDMPQHRENPNATTPEDIASSIEDLINFNVDVGMEVMNANSICINGQPWNDWVQGIGPQYDSAGNLVGGGFGDLDCVYTNPTTQQSYTFPCEDTAKAMFEIWGCSGVQNPWTLDVIMEYGAGIVRPPMFGGAGNHINVDVLYHTPATFDPVNGWSTAQVYDMAHIRPNLLSLDTMLFTIYLQQCFMEHSETETETLCSCTVDSDCGDYQRCNEGLCQQLRDTDEYGNCYTASCAPMWVDAICSPISLANIEVGACCGDGVVQSGSTYSEECDPGVSNGPPCSDSCQLIEQTGACCTATGCMGSLTEKQCHERGGSFSAGQPCSEEVCPMVDPEGNSLNSGACCAAGDCHDGMSASECASNLGQLHIGQSCNSINYCRMSETRGACCTAEGCVQSTELDCRNRFQGAFTPNVSCADVNFCSNESYGSCCTATGCANQVSASSCQQQGGSFALESCGDRNFCIDSSNPEPTIGSCCANRQCYDAISYDRCKAMNGAFNQVLCEERMDCRPDEPQTGSCCANGVCYDDLSPARCEALRGVFDTSRVCEQREDCKPQVPVGSCCIQGQCHDEVSADDCKLKRGSFDESRMCVERDDCRKQPVTGACCINGRCSVMLEEDCAKQRGRFTANQPCTGKACLALEPAEPVKPSKGCSTGDGLGGTLSALGILALAMMRRRRDEDEARL